MKMTKTVKKTTLIEPPHEKKKQKNDVRPAKTQISLGIRQSDQSLRSALNG